MGCEDGVVRLYYSSGDLGIKYIYLLIWVYEGQRLVSRAITKNFNSRDSDNIRPGPTVRFKFSEFYLRSRVDSELKFALLSVVYTQSLEKKGGKSRSGTSAEGVEDKESLKSGTLVSQFPDSVQTEIDYLFSDGVVASSVVVGSIFLEKLHFYKNVFHH